MRKLYSCTFLLLAGLGAMAQTLTVSATIKPTFYGQNFWFTDNKLAPSPDPNASQDLTSWPEVLSSGVRVLRVGGTNYNDVDYKNSLGAGITSTKPTNPLGYVKIVDRIRAQGCEPMITVPYNGNDGVGSDVKNIDEQAKAAARIVELINVVHKRNVKYFIIANEPETDYSPGITAEKIATYIKAFSTAMKKVDATIKIIGPELSGYVASKTMTDELLADPSLPTSIKGEIEGMSGIYYIDYFSYHEYPSSKFVSSRTGAHNIINSPMDFNAYNDDQIPLPISYGWRYAGIYKRISHLKEMISANFDRSTTLKIAITEVNIKGTAPFIDGLNSDISDGALQAVQDPNSFIMSQWLIENMCIAMLEDVSFFNFWSVKEGNKDAFGYMHGTSGEKKPAYWAYSMVANNFKGTIYSNQLNTNQNFKSFAAKNADGVAVIVMNQDENATFQYNISFNATSPAGTAEKVKFDMSIPNSFSSASAGENIGPNTTLLLLFDCNGNLKVRTRLSLSEMVNADLASYDPNDAPFTIGNFSPPSFNISSTGSCPGSNNASVSIDGGLTGNWFRMPEGTTLNQNANSQGSLGAGSYLVEINGATCGSSFELINIPEYSPYCDAGEDVQICIGQSATLGNIYSNTLYTYNWSPSTGLIASDGQATASPSSTTTYSLSVGDANCSTEGHAAVILRPGTPDLYVMDTPSDVGIESNPDTGPMWISQDIWVRKANDGITTGENADHSTSPNYVYVKVHNRGCAASAATGNTLITHWAKASTGLNWPNDWDGSQTMSSVSGCSGNINPTSGYVENSAGKAIPSITPGAEMTFTYTWNVPDPDDYSCVNAGNDHFCLLSRISDPDLNESPGSIYANARNSNNIAWRNITILPSAPIPNPGNGQTPVDIFVHNTSNEPRNLKLEFTVPGPETNDPYLNYGSAVVTLNPVLAQKWTNVNFAGTGITKLSSYSFRIDQFPAGISELPFQPNEYAGLNIRFQFQIIPASNKTFHVNVAQFERAAPTGNYTIVGGEQYQINLDACPELSAGPAVSQGRLCSRTYTVYPYYSGVTYTWTNGSGAVIGYGESISYSAAASETIKVSATFPKRCEQSASVAISVVNDWRKVCFIREPISAIDKPCAASETVLPASITGIYEFTGKSTFVSTPVIVTPGSELIISGSELKFDVNGGIKVLPGAKLRISGSDLYGCGGAIWKGIDITGNSIETTPVTITNCYVIGGTVSINKVSRPVIEKSVFTMASPAVALQTVKGFDIRGNLFYSIETAIETKKTVSDFSTLKENYFLDVKTAFNSVQDNHNKLDVVCNKFERYSEYAMKLNGSVLKEQGTPIEGTGNTFVSRSPFLNHELYYDGPSTSYYYNPNQPVSLVTNNTLKAISIAASSDKLCFNLTTRLAKVDNESQVKEENVKKNQSTPKLTCQPNPFKSSATLVYSSYSGFPVSIVIYNLTGQRLIEQKLSSTEGLVTFDMLDLPNGMYACCLITEGQIIATVKIVKSN